MNGYEHTVQNFASVPCKGMEGGEFAPYPIFTVPSVKREYDLKQTAFRRR